jgi:hypothetical protein
VIRYAKSSFSDASGCVEVALLADGVFLRDSKNTSKEPHHLLPTSGEHSLRAFEMANSICHDCQESPSASAYPAQRQASAGSGRRAVLQHLGWIASVISVLVLGGYRNLRLRGARKFLWDVYEASQCNEQHLVAAAEALKAIHESSPLTSLVNFPSRRQRLRSSPAKPSTPLVQPRIPLDDST